MVRHRKWMVLGLVAALPLAGCLEFFLIFYGITCTYTMALTGGYTPPYKAATRMEGTLSLDISADVGGLAGTYDVTVSETEGPEFGSFTGTGTVKRGRFVTIKDSGSPELLATVDAMVQRATGEQVTITSAKAKVKSWQQPGGVAAGFAAKVKYKGTVDSGPDAGKRIKGGKFQAGAEQSTTE